MNVYTNKTGSHCVSASVSGLSVVVTRGGHTIHTGALANEEQPLDEYMDMLGYIPASAAVPAGVDKGAGDDTTTYAVQLDVGGHVAGFGVKEHWSVRLAKAMERAVVAQRELAKATAEAQKATAEYEQAKTDAENSILGIG